MSMEDRLSEIERRLDALETRAKIKANGRETTLSEYGRTYQEAYGTNSEPPWAELAGCVPKAERKVGHAEAVSRWARFLRGTEDARYARPARWLQSLGQWAGRGR